MWEDIQESFIQNLTSTCGAEVASGALCMLLIAWSNQKQQNLTTDPPVISKKYFWFKIFPKIMESEPAMKKLWRCHYLGGGNSQLVLSVTKKTHLGPTLSSCFWREKSWKRWIYPALWDPKKTKMQIYQDHRKYSKHLHVQSEAPTHLKSYDVLSGKWFITQKVS